MAKFVCKVPSSNYVKPSTETKLESLRVKNRLQAMNLLKDANEKAPSCSQPRKDFTKPIMEEKPKVVFARKSVPTFKVIRKNFLSNILFSLLNTLFRIKNCHKLSLGKITQRCDSSDMFRMSSIVYLHEKIACGVMAGSIRSGATF